MSNYDYEVQDHGSVLILTPLSDECRSHVKERMPDDVLTWGGGRLQGFVVEPRYIGPIVEDLQSQGFVGYPEGV